MSIPAAPEVEPISSMILHPLLQDPKFLAAVFAVILSIVAFSALRPRTKSRAGRSGTPVVLLTGSPDAGKTSLFTKLAHGTRTETHTSSTASSTTVSLGVAGRAKVVRLVDLPGHARLRDEVKSNLKTAAGVVFVVDIQALIRYAGTIAEELPPLLTTLSSIGYASGQPIKLLLLATKTDLLSRPAPSGPAPDISPQSRQTAIDRLTSVLTREMDRLKQARASTGGRIEGIGRVQSSGGSFWKRLFGGSAAGGGDEVEAEEDEALVWGGKGPFKWEDVEGVEIEWVASALGPVKASGDEGTGLDEVKEWLSTV